MELVGVRTLTCSCSCPDVLKAAAPIFFLAAAAQHGFAAGRNSRAHYTCMHVRVHMPAPKMCHNMHRSHVPPSMWGNAASAVHQAARSSLTLDVDVALGGMVNKQRLALAALRGIIQEAEVACGQGKARAGKIRPVQGGMVMQLRSSIMAHTATYHIT